MYRSALVIGLCGFSLVLACGDDADGGADGGDGGARDGGLLDAGSMDAAAPDDGGRDGGSVADTGSGDASDRDATSTPEAGPALPERPSNATCSAPPRPPTMSGDQLAAVPAFPNMDFEGLAIGLLRSRLGASGPLRWFAVERDGDIWTFVDANASKDGLAADGTSAVEQAQLFLDLPAEVHGIGGEGGLLGAALDPEFGLRDDANYIYLHYTINPENTVWRFRVGAQGAGFAIQESERIFSTPSGGGNHWGGDLEFGPDGYLYISLGDGGGGYTAGDAANLDWLRGKILRIDPRGATSGYAIPPGNPYRLADPNDPASAPNSLCDNIPRAELEARTAACPEVFARGFRNPWRIGFDRELHRLWVGDVGEGKEEVDLVLAGHDYGWQRCDGINPTASCPPTAISPLIAPVAQFRQGATVSVTGGTVYRGSALGSAFFGAYVFSEVYAGEILVIDQPYGHVTWEPFAVTNTFEHPDDVAAGALPRFRKIAGISLPLLVSFTEDENAELLAITFGAGKGQAIFRLVPPGEPAADTIPALLSETGCVDPLDPTRPAAGVIPYDINAPFWSDRADKERFLAIPDGTAIHIGDDGDFELPPESVLVKHFRLDGRLVETRLLVRHQDGGWAGYTYIWREDQSDAVKASPAGESRSYDGQVWKYPSRAQCMTCHTAEAGFSLGLETPQLNRDFAYAPGREANQIDTLAAIGMFDDAVPSADTLPAFPAPFGAEPLEARARAYLHANCANCHREGRVPDLVFATPLADTGLCDDAPAITPAAPASSPLLALMREPDPTRRMPKNAGTVIDDQGARLIEDWIGSLNGCPNM
jgi:uncharacterized repeat protein (TIGR03806 family)